MPVISPNSSPAGKLEWSAGSATPAGYLHCNGATISRTTYAALYLAIGDRYGAGDGSTTFKIPDMRGEFIRGSDSGRGVDAGRVLGSAQAGQMSSHTHGVAVSSSLTGGSGIPPASNGAFLAYNGYTNAAGGTENTSENRPRNVAMLPCIKF